jgi:hypothetical protein
MGSYLTKPLGFHKSPDYGEKRGNMPAKKAKVRRRHKYCPVCKEVVPMSVVRQAEDDDDLYWLLCPSCNNAFALTRQEYHRGKRPDISAIRKDKARTYHTDQTYSVGELIYHRKLDDVGLVVDKEAAPGSVNCSGAIIVSFMELGQKMLIEGYAMA